MMLKLEFSGLPGFGAGIVFGREKERLLIVTAHHVVHKGDEHPPIRVELKGMTNYPFTAKLLKFDATADFAVLGVDNPKINICSLPFDRLGDATELKRRSDVSAVGNPNGVEWAMPVDPDKVSEINSNTIVFQSKFIGEGHSGGALLNENGAIVGMILADDPPFGRAAKIDSVLQLVKQWGYAVQLQAASEKGRTLLHDAAQAGDVAGIRSLLAACGDPNAKSDDGAVPLHHAAASGSSEAMLLLLKAGTDVNVMDGSGLTPLQWAAMEKQTDGVRFLIKAGARINAKNRYGATALHYAVEGPTELVKILVLAGADVNATNNYRQTPLHVAIEKRPDKIQSTFASEYPRWLEVVKLLIGAGAKIDPTAVFDSVRFDEVENVQLLLKAVSNLNATVTSSLSSYYPPGYTLLYWAAELGKVEMLKLLIEAGADLNIQSKWGETALSAAFKGEIEAVQDVLIAHGARLGKAEIDK